jgi:hypothetical protein
MTRLLDLFSATEATVLPPTATVAAPAPSKTSNFPLVLIDAVHLPTHFKEPAPNEVAAATHFPERDDFEAAMYVVAIVKSPVCPLPTQSKTCAGPATVVPLETLNTGAFFTDDD